MNGALDPLPYRKQYLNIIKLIAILSAMRCALDWVLIYKWQHPVLEILANHNMFSYGYTIYLGMAAIGFFAVRLDSSAEETRAKMRLFYIKTAGFWVIFPLVTIITVIGGSSYDLTIPLFKYLPGFMVEHNYLPLGMVVVMPIIVVCYFYFFIKYMGFGWLKSFIAVSAGCWLLYLLFYQYGLRAAFYFRDHYNLLAFMGFYSTLMLTFLRSQTIYFDRCFEIKKHTFNRIIELNIAITLILFIVGGIQHFRGV